MTAVAPPSEAQPSSQHQHQSHNAAAPPVASPAIRIVHAAPFRPLRREAHASSTGSSGGSMAGRSGSITAGRGSSIHGAVTSTVTSAVIAASPASRRPGRVTPSLWPSPDGSDEAIERAPVGSSSRIAAMRRARALSRILGRLLRDGASKAGLSLGGLGGGGASPRASPLASPDGSPGGSPLGGRPHAPRSHASHVAPSPLTTTYY